MNERSTTIGIIWALGLLLGCGGSSMVGDDRTDAGVDRPRVTDECGNGLDDDGDEAIDEDCYCARDERQDCFPSGALGECGPGSMTCVAAGGEWGRWGSCEDAPAPIEEACGDDTDDDCDGAVDEGCTCEGSTTRGCGAGSVGACREGTQRCVDGRWSGCEGAVLPTPEVCANGVDDDCDGTVDDPSVCDCRPSPELCANGIDDDCDGRVDEPDACDDSCSPVAEVCANDMDDDCDGRVDESASEICGDGIDQDCDGSDLPCEDDAGMPDPTDCVGPATFERFAGIPGRPFAVHATRDAVFVVYSGLSGDGVTIARVDLATRSLVPSGSAPNDSVAFSDDRRVYWAPGEGLYLGTHAGDDWSLVSGSATWFDGDVRLLMTGDGRELLFNDRTAEGYWRWRVGASTPPTETAGAVPGNSPLAVAGPTSMRALNRLSAGYQLVTLSGDRWSSVYQAGDGFFGMGLTVDESAEWVWLDTRSSGERRFVSMAESDSEPTFLGAMGSMGSLDAASSDYFYSREARGFGLNNAFVRYSRSTRERTPLHVPGTTHPPSEEVEGGSITARMVDIYRGCAFVLVGNDPSDFSYLGWIAD